MNSYKHSVSLDVEKCKGCTDCLKRCPTEAIRIREGHARIDSERCIDCGECIRVCKNKAKRAVCDKLSMIPKDKWTVALPAPTLYGQFDNLDDIDYVLQGLLDYGFDDVYEVACAAEIVSDYTRKYLKDPTIQKPIISSACPVIKRLISLRYPFLCDNVLPLLPPVEVAASEARRRALEKNPHLTRDDVCIVFISPCPAKVSYVKNNVDRRSEVDLVVSMSDIYFELIGIMKKGKAPAPFSRSGMVGIGWASSGGESTAVFSEKFLAADGIENVLNVLEEIDNGTFPELEFVELNACQGGCVGGSMTVTNPYIAKARLQNLRRYLPVSQNWAEKNTIPSEALSDVPVIYTPPKSLDDDRVKAMQIMHKISDFAKTLPGIDCGSCGAPTCAAFAEDVIRGECSADDCIIRMREILRKEGNDGGKTDDGCTTC